MRQEEPFPASQVAQGSSHCMHVEPVKEKGGLQAVHSVAAFSHCEQGGVQRAHDVPFKKNPSLQTVQTGPLHSTQPTEHLTQSVRFSSGWNPFRHSAHIVNPAAT